jgi:hypothetical protein
MSGKVSDRLTAADRKIWDRMPLAGRLMARRDQHDADVMRARTLAHGRGATAVEIERNVLAFDWDSFPVPTNISAARSRQERQS